MGEAAKTSENKFSIVITGYMDPRLHHPTWYRIIEAINESEQKEALSQNIVIVPTLSQFNVPEFKVVCTTTTWEISTTEAQHRPRILQTAKLVFKKLYETPASYYGMNTDLERETARQNINHDLADMMALTGLGLVGKDYRSASISFSTTDEPCTTNIEIRASRHTPSFVFMGQNTQYRLNSPDRLSSPEYFDIGEKLEAHFDTDYQSALEAMDRIVKGLNDFKGIPS
jgi:hypothetical protein